MSRAILKDDVLIKLCADEKKGVEVGVIPARKSLDVLRFDGEKVVDITTLDKLWVDKYGKLHCVKVGGSQLVDMRYNERKRLTKDNGQWRLKTPQEIATEKIEAQRNTLYKDRIKRYPEIGDQMDAILKYLDTIPNKPEELNEIITRWKAVKQAVPIPEDLRSR